ncbi:MAG: hypothetical protein F9K46_12045 [Anaerolineae bacterium]|nr:MAG: hypothetical protein F9K46_12045 [Anaerolineae bacterium]
METSADILKRELAQYAGRDFGICQKTPFGPILTPMELSAADYLQRAHEHKREYRYADAVQACDAALALDPTLAAAYLLRADARFCSHGEPYTKLMPSLSEAEQAVVAADIEQAVHFAANDLTLLM